MSKPLAMFGWQMAVAASLLLALFGAIAVYGQSLGVLYTGLQMFAFSTVVAAIELGFRLGGKWKIMGWVGLAVVAAGVLYVVLSVAERIYWKQGDSYPAFLTTDLPDNATSFDDLHKACASMIEFQEKKDGLYARCGSFSWEAATWHIPADNPIADQLRTWNR